MPIVGEQITSKLGCLNQQLLSHTILEDQEHRVAYLVVLVQSLLWVTGKLLVEAAVT